MLEEKREGLQATELQYVAVKVQLDTFIVQTMQEGSVSTVDGITLKMPVDQILMKNDSIEVQFSCGA